MAGKKCAKKLRADGQGAEGKLEVVGEEIAEGVSNRRHTRASNRQTKSTAKETADAIIGTSSSPEVKQTSENAKRGRVRKRVSDPEMKENCLPSVAPWDWTEQEEKVFLESLSTTKPGLNFWRLVAERVPGRSAEDCFNKFYSGRKKTRAVTRSRTEELDSWCSVRNGANYVGSLRSKTPMDVKKPARETGVVGRASTGPAKVERRISGEEHDDAFTQQTIATSHRAKRRRIDAACSSPDVEQKKATNPKSVQKAKNVRLSQRESKGNKKRTGKQKVVDKLQVRTSTPGVTIASRCDRSPVSDVGDEEIESPSAFRVSDDDDHWTKIQEAALQEAYSTIRPSANFWHLISKRVPGRSAEECFNKFYAGHPTPPRVSQRSCLKVVDCPPTLPNPPKAKAPKGKRLLEAHRTVRNILRRQQVDDKDYEADAFAALEPADVVHGVMEKAREEESATLDGSEIKFCVHIPLPGSTEDSTTQGAQSDKENRKPKAVEQSRDFGISQLQLFSPEILKKVKDPLMLDKYIDHLHQRRRRRPATKSAQKNAQRTGALLDLSKNGLDFREVRLDAIHRAKQELRDVFLRPGSAVNEPFLDLVDDIADEDDDDSVDSQMFL